MANKLIRGLVLLLLFCTITELILSGCSGGKRDDIAFNALMQEERNAIETPYLIKSFYEYDDKYKEFVETNKNNYVRWTAHIKKINDNKNLTLREDGYPAIKASFNYNLKEYHSLKEGDILTITGNPVKYDMNMFISDWYLANCRIEQTTDEEKNMVLNYESIFMEQDKKAEQEAEEKVNVMLEAKTLEIWTKDNIVQKLYELDVLEGKGKFIDKSFGSKVVQHDSNSDGKSSIKNPYTLELSIVTKNDSQITNISIMKDMVFNIANVINTNSNKIDFNICLVGVHFSNADNTSVSAHNFYIGINTIGNYFKETRSKSVGISTTNGAITNIDYDADSFYKWIEDNFTSPEDNSVLVENESWTTTSEKADINYGWVKANSNIYTGVKLYYGVDKKYIGTVLQVNDKFLDLQTGKRVRAIQLELSSGEKEWVNRNDIILSEYYIKKDDINLK